MNRLQFASLLCFVLLLSMSAHAQVRVSGQVLHGDEPTNNVTIKVLQDGSVLRTMLADRKGRFEMDIPFDKEYTLLFVCPFMLPVAIDVNTDLPEGTSALYEVPLTMRMYHRYSGMSEKLARQSIGEIRRTGSGEETFTFEPFSKVIEALRPIYAESQRREAAGEEPIASESFSVDRETSETSSGKAETLSKGSSTVASSPVPEKKASESPKTDKVSRQADRHDVIATSRDLERERMRSEEERSDLANRRSEREGSEFIEESKELRRALTLEDAQRDRTIAEARIKKQKDQQALVAKEVHAGTPPSATKALVSQLVKHTVDDGTFLFEERLIVDDAGKRHEYRKAVYNWLLFDVTYYSKDDKEISEEEFERVRFALGI